MDYINNLRHNTMLLIQSVGVLQGTRWDVSVNQARQYLVSVDMDLNFASGLVEDMQAENFTQTIDNLAFGQYAKTGYKSIVIWVRKFGFEAHMAPTGDFWQIVCAYETQAAHWGFSEMCDYARGHKLGCVGVFAFIIAAAVFVGVWVFTGDIWAAIILFEILFDILIGIGEMFG